MFRCAVDHLQGGLLVFLLKTTCIPSICYSKPHIYQVLTTQNHMYTKYKLLKTSCIPSISYSKPHIYQG